MSLSEITHTFGAQVQIIWQEIGFTSKWAVTCYGSSKLSHIQGSPQTAKNCVIFCSFSDAIGLRASCFMYDSWPSNFMFYAW